MFRVASHYKNCDSAGKLTWQRAKQVLSSSRGWREMRKACHHDITGKIQTQMWLGKKKQFTYVQAKYAFWVGWLYSSPHWLLRLKWPFKKKNTSESLHWCFSWALEEKRWDTTAEQQTPWGRNPPLHRPLCLREKQTSTVRLTLCTIIIFTFEIQ